MDKIKVFYVFYDKYNEDGSLCAQGMVSMYEDQKEANLILLSLNKKAVIEGYRINFYREYKGVLKDTFDYHIDRFNINDRLERLFN